MGKTTTCVNLGIGLARAGKKVLLVEADAQGSMAVSLGIAEPDELDVTLVNIMEKVINDENTGHVWYIHNPEYPELGNCIIFHKHRASHPYHRHGRAGSLRQTVRSIQGHDRYQIEVREGGGRKESSRAKEGTH